MSDELCAVIDILISKHLDYSPTHRCCSEWDIPHRRSLTGWPGPRSTSRPRNSGPPSSGTRGPWSPQSNALTRACLSFSFFQSFWCFKVTFFYFIMILVLRSSELLLHCVIVLVLWRVGTKWAGWSEWIIREAIGKGCTMYTQM